MGHTDTMDAVARFVIGAQCFLELETGSLPIMDTGSTVFQARGGDRSCKAASCLRHAYNIRLQ